MSGGSVILNTIFLGRINLSISPVLSVHPSVCCFHSFIAFETCQILSLLVAELMSGVMRRSVLHMQKQQQRLAAQVTAPLFSLHR